MRRYHRETPEMLTAPQLWDVTHFHDFYYGVTWELDRKSVFNWKDEEPGNFERKVKAFLDQQRLLRVLRDYILFTRKDDELHKFILRHHDTRPLLQERTDSASAKVFECSSSSLLLGTAWEGFASPMPIAATSHSHVYPALFLFPPRQARPAQNQADNQNHWPAHHHHPNQRVNRGLRHTHQHPGGLSKSRAGIP